jgi:hypothetical protein
MTQDEIIEMLKASCDKDRVDPEQNGFWVIVTDELVAFAKLVAQHEREEIMAMAESHEFSRMRGEFTPTSTDLICAIRARKQA